MYRFIYRLYYIEFYRRISKKTLYILLYYVYYISMIKQMYQQILCIKIFKHIECSNKINRKILYNQLPIEFIYNLNNLNI